MRNIMYEDCNNNAAFLKGLFIQIQALSDQELSWSISNVDFVPVYKGDFVGGVPDIEMEELYNFQNKILDEHTVIVTHNIFMGMLENIRTIYEGEFRVLINNKPLNLRIFDGDIIEISGEMEDKIKL